MPLPHVCAFVCPPSFEPRAPARGFAQVQAVAPALLGWPQHAEVKKCKNDTLNALFSSMVPVGVMIHSDRRAEDPSDFAAHAERLAADAQVRRKPIVSATAARN